MRRRAREDTRTKLTPTKPFFNILQTIINFLKIQLTGSTNCSAVQIKAILHSQIQLIIYLIYDFVAALLFKHITLSWITLHVKVAPGHIIGSEIGKQDGITMSNCLNAGGWGGGREEGHECSGRLTSVQEEVLVRISLSHLTDLCGELNSHPTRKLQQTQKLTSRSGLWPEKVFFSRNSPTVRVYPPPTPLTGVNKSSSVYIFVPALDDC